MAMHSVADMAASISANLKRIAKEKGQPLPVDLENREAVRAYLKANDDKFIGRWNQQLKRKRFDHVYKQSLWSGQAPIAFDFSKWDSSKQLDVQMAERLKEQARSLAQLMTNPDDEPFNVLMRGAPGTGKTSLAIAMLEYVRHSGYRWEFIKHNDKPNEKTKRYVNAFFVATDEVVELLNQRIHNDVRAKDRLDQVVSFAKTADVLVLDDFGTEGGMKGDLRPVRKDMQELMYNINNARFGEKFTIVTTNNTDEELKRMYNEKLISRLITGDAKHILDFDELMDVRASMI